MLLNRCPVCLSVLSVTLVYCGQRVGWIKIKLGTEVGPGLGHILLDGEPAHPKSDTAPPQFSAYLCCGQTVGWIKMPLDTEVDLCPGHIVLDGYPAPPGRGTAASPLLLAHDYCGQTVTHLSYC